MIDLIFSVVVFAISLVATRFLLPRLWRGDDRTLVVLEDSYYRWLPMTRALAREMIRPLPALAVLGPVMFGSIVLRKLSVVIVPGSDAGALLDKLGISIGALSLFSAVLLQCSVIAFRRPRCIVAPRHRSEPGLAIRILRAVSARWRKR